MTKLQKILSGVLVVQALLAVVVFWPRSSAAAAAELFPDLETASITKITFADNEGSRVELARQGEGWVVASGADYPADGTKIEPVLDKLVALQGNRLVARTATSHKRLQVAEDDFLRKVQVTTDSGKTYTLYMGSSPTAQTTHVRVDGQDETYLVNNFNIWEMSQMTTSWIDTAYTDLDQTTITAVSLQNSNGTFTFSKGADDSWTMDGLAEGETLNQNSVSTLLSRISGLHLTQPLGTTELPEYELDNPQAKLVVTTDADNATHTYTLLVGAQNPDDDTYTVKWSEADYYVSVSSFSVSNMISNGRTDFLVVPPTPTPDANTGG